MLVLFSSLCKQSISKAVTDTPGTFSFPSSESCWKLKSQAFLRCFGQNTSLGSTSQKSVSPATEPRQHPCALTDSGRRGRRVRTSLATVAMAESGTELAK